MTLKKLFNDNPDMNFIVNGQFFTLAGDDDARGAWIVCSVEFCPLYAGIHNVALVEVDYV